MVQVVLGVTVESTSGIYPILLALAATLVAGCLQTASSDDDGTTVLGPDAAFPLWNIDLPTVINSTLDPGALEFWIYQELGNDECPFFHDEPQIGSYRLWDRDGLVVEAEYEAGQDERRLEFRVPLTNKSPYVFVASPNICWSVDSRLVNLTDAVPVVDFEKSSLVDETHLRLRVPPGEVRTETTWSASPWHWDLWNAGAFREERTGHRYGTVTISEEGSNRTVCSETFTPFDHEGECIPFYLHTGSYRVVLELDQPAVLETEWIFGLWTNRFGPQVCRYGFEWPELCG